MDTEIEAKWLRVDHDEMRTKLKRLGAKLVQAEKQMVRRVFDYPDKRLTKVNGWVRVRNEGNVTTLSYKQLDDRSLQGTEEITVVVDDYETTCQFLESIGLVSKSCQETKRESWVLDDCEIELDTWPWIPSFVEIEAKSETALKAVAEKLGFDFADALHGSVETAYQDVYEVTDEEIDSWEDIRFSEVPDWLAEKKK